MDVWTECKDRLPDVGVEVLLYGPGVGQHIGCLFIIDGAEFPIWATRSALTPSNLEVFTHWRDKVEDPLP